MAKKPGIPKQIDALRHGEATRRNIPTAEMESFFRREEDTHPLPPKHYPRARPLAEGETRTEEEPSVPEIIWNGARITITEAQQAELAATGTLTLSDAQLVWRGKDRQDWSDLVVNVPPLYIQEKIHPKAIIDDLKRRTAERREATTDAPDLFADFNGIEPDQRAEFYQHDQHWSNRMILGDSLQVMASLSERESLKGKVQCIYFDPPYGIKFNSNWQVSTQSRDVKDGKQTDISREPEQVKAFRDTWKDGIHSYLTYLRDRLTAMRDLLTESGSVFVQIGDENVHRVRTLMDEVFGTENFVSQITVVKTAGRSAAYLPGVSDAILWYARNAPTLKYRKPLTAKGLEDDNANVYRWLEVANGERRRLSDAELVTFEKSDGRVFRLDNFTSQKPPGSFEFELFGKTMRPGSRYWSTGEIGVARLKRANRLVPSGFSAAYVRYMDDFGAKEVGNVWTDTGTGSFTDDKVYVVQSGTKTVARCILMTTDPGDLVLDPTCGSGTTAYVAEQWGRRWITMDTSRVALALARTRIMSARYPWYLLADSREGRAKEAALTRTVPLETPVHDDLRQGFVYDRVPRIMLGKIANNPLIDDIWERYQPTLQGILNGLNHMLGTKWEEWEVPRDLPEDKREWNAHYGVKIAEQTIAQVDGKWPNEVWKTAGDLHDAWWEQRIARQREIDASIAARADVEYLYDKPYTDPARVRVAGPFTVESLSPHRVLPASEEELIETIDAADGKRSATDADLAGADFAGIVIEYLKAEGVKQQAKGDRITFESIAPWPGNFIGAAATFIEGEDGPERRAAILVGPEYGTVGRQDLVAAAREAVDNRFDVLIACAFNFDAHSSELDKLGSLTILKARINPDMHMSEELKNTGRGNMFVVFGEPDIDVLDVGGATVRVKVNGVDVFDPNTGDIRSSDTKGIAAWFIDTDYNEESFFVRHAYFLGANDPYKSLKTALQSEIDEDAWATLYSDTSRPFERPAGGRIAVKVINHFGDEVMKVFGV
ncbi:site-specific DNA-methyltransferase [Sphingomonas sp. G-3-2-10]|uniref:site-specific DNA-methyltransferase n=1 Tax=Sphingomonas sp. G-3-2-10 TaxID=2728838 RepID=UPI00146BD9D8|nr:site-specific DNA-methyltransferase [Sphingomonas sp. G-3-2-10]NML08356.1 site-specific DNA-methyltransferase [Sphingomonas sp. G-3-2-10]